MVIPIELARLNSPDFAARQLMNEKSSVTLPGTVEKVIEPTFPGEPEKAQIAVEGADDLYREIRIENTLKTEDGVELSLKKGAEVEVTVEAEIKETNTNIPASLKRAS